MLGDRTAESTGHVLVTGGQDFVPDFGRGPGEADRQHRLACFRRAGERSTARNGGAVRRKHQGPMDERVTGVPLTGLPPKSADNWSADPG